MYDKQLTALLVIDPYNDFISQSAREYALAKLDETGESHGVRQRHARVMLAFF